MREAWGGKTERAEAVLKDGTLRLVEDRVDIDEVDEAGAGVVSLEVAGEAICFRPDPTATKWLKSSQCADGAFFEFVDGRLRLHIVELKSKLTLKKWSAAINQFRGMFLRARALSAVLGFDRPDDVVCYIAFKEDDLTSQIDSNPILKKLLLGRDAKGPLIEWRGGEIELDVGVLVPFVRIQRDDQGNSTHRVN